MLIRVWAVVCLYMWSSNGPTNSPVSNLSLAPGCLDQNAPDRMLTVKENDGEVCETIFSVLTSGQKSNNIHTYIVEIHNHKGLWAHSDILFVTCQKRSTSRLSRLCCVWQASGFFVACCWERAEIFLLISVRLASLQPTAVDLYELTKPLQLFWGVNSARVTFGEIESLAVRNRGASSGNLFKLWIKLHVFNKGVKK